jgi:uncharacterized membrane protein YuzA (DUF378 family)
MKKYIEFVWQLMLTPIYYVLLGMTALVILIGLGRKEFKEFWKKNK